MSQQRLRIEMPPPSSRQINQHETLMLLKFKCLRNDLLFFKNEEIKCVFVMLVLFGLYIDVLSVPMGYSVVFCIHEHTFQGKFNLFA